MSNTPRTDTLTLASAMDILARDIQSSDGAANAAIAEAAQRLREVERENAEVWRLVDNLHERIAKLSADKAYWGNKHDKLLAEMMGETEDKP
jgi:CII-binding regulator of phage lambda lysogenization HflD